MEDKNIYNFTLEVESEERIDKLLAKHFLNTLGQQFRSGYLKKMLKSIISSAHRKTELNRLVKCLFI